MATYESEGTKPILYSLFFAPREAALQIQAAAKRHDVSAARSEGRRLTECQHRQTSILVVPQHISPVLCTAVNRCSKGRCLADVNIKNIYSRHPTAHHSCTLHCSIQLQQRKTPHRLSTSINLHFSHPTAHQSCSLHPSNSRFDLAAPRKAPVNAVHVPS